MITEGNAMKLITNRTKQMVMFKFAVLFYFIFFLLTFFLLGEGRNGVTVEGKINSNWSNVYSSNL